MHGVRPRSTSTIVCCSQQIPNNAAQPGSRESSILTTLLAPDGGTARVAGLDAGAMVETLETSHTWSSLGELYAAVIQRAGAG